MPRARLARMKSLLFLAAALRGRPHECPPAHRLRPAVAGSAAARRLVDQRAPAADRGPAQVHARRSEEHTSELQSLMRISYAVFCLKKKNKQEKKHTIEQQLLITHIKITHKN